MKTIKLLAVILALTVTMNVAIFLAFGDSSWTAIEKSCSFLLSRQPSTM